ncbi:hypothetical protein ACVME8_009495 [Bradyrhizobium diazoefficiens]
MGSSLSPAPFYFAHFRKVNDLGHLGKHNATKPNKCLVALD